MTVHICHNYGIHDLEFSTYSPTTIIQLEPFTHGPIFMWSPMFQELPHPLMIDYNNNNVSPSTLQTEIRIPIPCVSKHAE